MHAEARTILDLNKPRDHDSALQQLITSRREDSIQLLAELQLFTGHFSDIRQSTISLHLGLSDTGR